MASRQSKNLIPQRFVELLQFNSEFTCSFNLKRAKFMYITYRRISEKQFFQTKQENERIDVMTQ